MLGLLSPVVAQDDSFRVSPRKMYVATAETQDYAALLDEIFSKFSESKANEFSVMPIDCIQLRVKQVTLDDFDRKLDPVLLLRLNQSAKIKVVLFFYLEKKEKGFVCRVAAREFPSGVFVDETTFDLSLKEKSSDAAVAHIENFVLQIMQKRADFGYAFSANEKGVLIVTDSYESSAFHNLLRGLTNAKKITNPANPAPLAVKSVFYYFEGDSNYYDVANALIKASDAKAVIIQSEHASKPIVVLPLSTVKPSILENKLPLWPPYDGFRYFQMDAELPLARDFGFSFYPKRTNIFPNLERYTEQKKAGARVVFYNAIRTLEDIFYNANESWDAALIEQMSRLYAGLAQTFTSFEPEGGWININAAEFLYQTKKYENALEALAKALSVFDAFSNQFGPLFVYVLRGQIYEDLHNSEKAATAYRAAATIADDLKDDRTLAWLYFRLGAMSLDRNRPLEAWDYFGFSSEKYMGLGETITVIKLYTKIGILLRQSKMLLKSRHYLEQSLKLATTLENDREIADATYQLAATEEELGETAKALAHFEQAGDFMEVLADTLNMASVEEHIGDILLEQQKWRGAQASFEYAARFYLYADDIDGVIRCLVKSADASVARRKWQRAQSTLDEALGLANRRSRQDWAAIILHKKGMAHIKAGEYGVGQKELELAKSKSLSKQDIEKYMKSLTRELEAELDNLQPDKRK